MSRKLRLPKHFRTHFHQRTPVALLEEEFRSDIVEEPSSAVPRKASWFQKLFQCLVATFWARRTPKIQGITLDDAKTRCERAIDSISVKEGSLVLQYEQANQDCLAYVDQKKVQEAMHSLRQKKMFHRQLNRIRAHKYNLSCQLHALEAAEENKDVLELLGEVSTALRGSQVEEQAVDDQVASMHELLQDTAACSQYLTEKTAFEDLEEDIELEQEVRALMNNIPPQPPTARAVEFPQVPTSTPIKKHSNRELAMS